MKNLFLFFLLMIIVLLILYQLEKLLRLHHQQRLERSQIEFELERKRQRLWHEDYIFCIQQLHEQDLNKLELQALSKTEPSSVLIHLRKRYQSPNFHILESTQSESSTLLNKRP